MNTILNIYVENYLYGVVGYEMSPPSSMEALKAQAVAARTYAMRKKAGRTDALYDVTDTANDQVYRGYSGSADYANVVRAVDATRGGVLYYGSALAQCYYCASNGGQTESTRNAWGTALSYSTVKDDPYDLESAATVKTAVVNKDLSGLNESLRTALINGLTMQLAQRGVDAEAADVRVNGIESITACDSRYAAPSRVYRSLTFKLSVTGTAADGERETGSLSVSIPTFGAFEDWYGLSINTEDNETVWVTETERAFSISFRRFGHGVGMSQRGAQVMAGTYGMSMAKILEFYYPGTKGRRLELADSTSDTKAVAPQPEQQAIATARLLDSTDLLNAPDGGGAVTATVAAGAVVDVYAVQGSWAAVGSSGKYGYIRTRDMQSFTLANASVNRPDGIVYGVAKRDAMVLELPVAQASAVSSMIEGARVQVFAWTEEWVMVEAADGIIGFVPIDTLGLDEASARQQQKSAPAESPSAGVTVAPDDLYGQLREDAPLYAENNAFAGELDLLYQGSIVRIIAYDEEWALVRTQSDQEGYIPLAAVTALDTDRLRGGSGDAAAAPDEGGEITRVSGTKYLYVREDATKVYADWSTGSEVIAVLNAGDRVRIGAYNKNWACVRIGDGTGYILKSALTRNRAASVDGGSINKVPPGTYASAVINGVAVYRSYDVDSDQIASLEKGERVEVGAYNSSWVLVRVGELTGYVRIEDLKLE